jgi:hypothetical protein
MEAIGMPYLSTFVYCEGITVTPQKSGQIVSLTNPQHIFTPDYIPGQFSFGISFGILDLDVKTKEYAARYVFKGPDGKIIVDTQKIILSRDNVETPPFDLPNDMHGVIMNLDFRNVPLKEEGVYESEIFIDDISLGVRKIKIVGKNNHGYKN